MKRPAGKHGNLVHKLEDIRTPPGAKGPVEAWGPALHPAGLGVSSLGATGSALHTS